MIETETVMARKPASLYHVEFAVAPFSALTAWQGFFRKAKAERGQDISAEALRRGAVAFCEWNLNICGPMNLTPQINL